MLLLLFYLLFMSSGNLLRGLEMTSHFTTGQLMKDIENGKKNCLLSMKHQMCQTTLKLLNIPSGSIVLPWAEEKTLLSSQLAVAFFPPETRQQFVRGFIGLKDSYPPTCDSGLNRVRAVLMNKLILIESGLSISFKALGVWKYFVYHKQQWCVMGCGPRGQPYYNA